MKSSIQSGSIVSVFVLGLTWGMGTLDAEEGSGPKILIKAFQAEGNTVVSARALQTLFERDFGVWPIPEAGIQATSDQIQRFLEAIGAFYARRGIGGTFVSISREILEKEEPPTLKEGVLKVAILESKDAAIPEPVPSWLFARGALTEAQERAQKKAMAKAEEERLRQEQEAAEKEREAAQKEREAAEAKERGEAAGVEEREEVKAVRKRPTARELQERLKLIEESRREAERVRQQEREERLKRIAEQGEEGLEATRKSREEAERVRQERMKLIEEARREAEQARKEAAAPAERPQPEVPRKTPEETERTRQERLRLIEEARREAEQARKEAEARQAPVVDEAQIKAREAFESGLRAQIEAKSRKNLEAGGVLINIKSFAVEGNTRVTTQTIEALFARYLLGIESPLVGKIERLFPPEGLYIRPDQLREFLEKILQYYGQLGHSGVYVYVPQETFAPSPDPLRLKLKNDQLKVQVVEGRIHDIRTSYEVQKRPWKRYLPWELAGEGGKEGAAKEADEPLSHKWRKGYIEKWAPIRPGDPIRKSELESYVEFLERRPGRSVAAVVQKAQGTEAAREVAALNGGDVDVELRVRDFDPLTFYIESSNTGTLSTIELRYRFGLVHNDLTGRGDILSLDVSPGAELDFLPANYSTFASYEAPLWNPRWTGRTLVAYSEFESVDLLGPNTSFVGKGLVLSGELKYKLWEGEKWALDIYDILDYQRSEVETPFGFTTTLKLLDIGVGTRLGRTRDYKMPLGESVACGWKPSLDFKLAYNLTELLDLSTADDFKESRARTEPGYHFFRILGSQRFTFDFADVGKPGEKEEEEKKEEEGPKGESPVAERERLRERLPPGKWLSIDQQAGLHYSPERLPSAKQMFIGGLNSVRGYPNSVLGGDRGFFLSSELRVDVSRMLEGRSTSEAKHWWKNFGIELVPFLIDVGMVRTNAAASSEEESTWIAGTGGGGRLYYKDILSARFNGGIALMDTGDDEDAIRSGNKEFHFDLALHF